MNLGLMDLPAQRAGDEAGKDEQNLQEVLQVVGFGTTIGVDF